MPDNASLPAANAELPLLVAAGYLNIDVVARVPRLPEPDQRVTAERIWRLVGGMAANAACAAAALGHPWAAQVELLAFVGDDSESAWALAEIERRGVSTTWSVRRAGGRTPRCIVLVEPDGRRVIVSEPNDYDDALVAQRLAVPERSGRPRLLYVDGYRMPGALPALAAARSAGWRTALDMDGLARSWRTEEGFCTLAQTCDVLFANRNTVDAIWPGLFGGTQGLEQAAHALNAVVAQHAAPGGVLVVTLGEQGALVFRHGEIPHHVGVLAVEPVDTTGAGDVFAGAFLLLLLYGHAPTRAAQLAAAAAGLSTTGFGAQGHLPAAAEVLAQHLPPVAALAP